MVLGLTKVVLPQVEETANGCVALQFIDMCHPGIVVMPKVVMLVFYSTVI